MNCCDFSWDLTAIPRFFWQPAGPVPLRWSYPREKDYRRHGGRKDDVLHIPMTNMSTMIVPGYVAQITTSFPKPGEYPLLCNEYCGLGHNHMWSNISVVAKEDWTAPVKTPAEGDSENE